MRKFQTRALGIEQGSSLLFSDFKENGEMWAGDGPREIRYNVKFSEAFQNQPAVTVGMSMWDMDQKTNQRADIAAEEISNNGFCIVFRTWGDTRIARVRADWMALGEVLADDDWDLY